MVRFGSIHPRPRLSCGFLVEAHEKFPTLQNSESNSAALLRDLIIPSMISIEEDYQRSLKIMGEDSYPWGRKSEHSVALSVSLVPI